MHFFLVFFCLGLHSLFFHLHFAFLRYPDSILASQAMHITSSMHLHIHRIIHRYKYVYASKYVLVTELVVYNLKLPDYFFSCWYL